MFQIAFPWFVHLTDWCILCVPVTSRETCACIHIGHLSLSYLNVSYLTQVKKIAFFLVFFTYKAGTCCFLMRLILEHQVRDARACVCGWKVSLDPLSGYGVKAVYLPVNIRCMNLIQIFTKLISHGNGIFVCFLVKCTIVCTFVKCISPGNAA